MTKGSARFFLATSLLALTEAALGNETVTYSYDSLGRLTRVERSGPVNNGVTADYGYDASDNRTNVTVTAASSSPPPSSPPPSSPPPSSPPPSSPPPSSPPAPMFSVSGAAVNEGSNLAFTITKTGSTTGTFSVGYATSNGSAAAYSDYQPASGTAMFLPSQTNVTVTVATTADNVAEPAETVLMTLSAPTDGATLSESGAQSTGTINASSGPPPPAPNQPPTAVPDSVSVMACYPTQIPVLANDSDPEGNIPLSVLAVTQGTKGTASVGVRGRVAYTPGNQTGTDVLTYTVGDSLGATSTATLTITITVGQC